ncbi:MAG: PAS domain S-box protein [Deltaproteobacteria bacterium]|nr:PAS domain S-box protein [Deltaproteobacteria bacterium]
MEQPSEAVREEKRRFLWLILVRIFIVTVLLGFSAVMELLMGGSALSLTYFATYYVLACSYLVSIVYLVLDRKVKNRPALICLQSFVDIFLISILVYAAGTIHSYYTTLYPLVIIYSALLIDRRGGVIAATASFFCYGMLISLEYAGILISPVDPLQSRYLDAGYAFSRVFTHGASFYIIAFLASFLKEKEQEARRLLQEKTSAFERLDVLHRSIIESVGTGIVTTDMKGCIKLFNRAAEEITKYRFADLNDCPIEQIFRYIAFENGNINQVNGQGNVKRSETEIISKTGEKIVVGFSFFPLMSPEEIQIGTIIIFRDLTPIKEMEKEIERNRRLAVIGEMSSVLAHEIRNPLATIAGSIQLLKKDILIDDSNRRLMDIVLRGKDQLESIMQDYLLLSRPKSTDYRPVDIKSLIEELVELMSFGADWGEDIEVSLDLCDGHAICGNENEIKQAIRNVILNAVQAMPDGGSLDIETKLDCSMADGECLLVVVSDTGIGVADENLPRITEPFFTTKERGTGLGLAIVKRVLDSHGGSLAIESEQAKGTRVVMRYPIRFKE